MEELKEMTQSGIRKLRPLLVKYCGRRTESNGYVWYDMPLNRVVAEYFNTGDICVHDSTMRLLDTLSPESLNIDMPVDPQQVHYFKERCDILILRGSNYLHEQMDWGYLADWIEALDMPVMCAGVGAQAASEREIRLPETGMRVWRAIADRAPLIGARGAFTAETLALNGIRNVEIVGCPTLFRGRNRNLKLRHRPDGPNRLTLSIRREVGPEYAASIDEFLAIQKRLIARLSLVSDLYLSCHGEPEEKAFFFRVPDQLKAATERLTARGWFDESTGRVLKDLYERRLYYVGSPTDYDSYAPQFDGALGYRVHAILPALAVGTPAIMFSYDTRSRELARALNVPLIEPGLAARTPLRELFDASRFADFEAGFAGKYDCMKQFIEGFGLLTRM